MFNLFHSLGGLGISGNFFPPCPELEWDKVSRNTEIVSEEPAGRGPDGRCLFISICKLARVKKTGKAAILSFVVIIVI